MCVRSVCLCAHACTRGVCAWCVCVFLKQKREWILKVATEDDEAVKDGKTRWYCICKLQ